MRWLLRLDGRPADAKTLLAQLEEAIEETHGRGWLAGAGLGALGSTAATIAAGMELTAAAAPVAQASAARAASTGATAPSTAAKVFTRKNMIAAGGVGAAGVAALIAYLLMRPDQPVLEGNYTLTADISLRTLNGVPFLTAPPDRYVYTFHTTCEQSVCTTHGTERDRTVLDLHWDNGRWETASPQKIPINCGDGRFFPQSVDMWFAPNPDGTLSGVAIAQTPEPACGTDYGTIEWPQTLTHAG